MIRRERFIAWSYVLPTVIIILALTIFPLVYSLRLSFCRWDMTTFGSHPQFIGLKNYARLFIDGRFYNAVTKTGIIVISALVAQTLLGVGVALLLHRRFRGRGILIAIFLIPLMISEIAAALCWGLIYDATFGPLNEILMMFHLTVKRVAWLVDHPLLSIITADIWQWSSFIMLITLAALQALPRDPYEAAVLDGASSWQIFRFMTLPLITPIVAIGVILRAMDAVKLFDKVYMLTHGGPGSASETVTYYIYLQAFRFWNLPYASAISFILLAIIVALITLFFKVVQIEE